MFDRAATFGWFDLLGLTLTLFGLWITVVQAIAARRSADEARDVAAAAAEAVSEARSHLAQNQLLVALTQLQQVIADIETAASHDEKAVLEFSLVRFGNAATESAGLLDSHESEHGSLANDLRTIGSDALDVKAALAKSTSSKTAKPSEELRNRLARINLAITGALVTLRTFIQGVDNV
jgi:hypothetical protein